MSMRFDRKKFFDGVKDRIDPTLNQEQVDGFEFLLTSFENDARWNDIRLIAYAFATIWHETAYSMQPVEEGYYLGKKAKAFQKKLRYYPCFGRGYVQLTWDSNYKKAGKALGLDLIANPDLALDPAIAFKVLTEGLFRGWFGGKLTTYINATKTDYVNARRCVNVLDKAGLIAGYAKSFEKILTNSAAVSTGQAIAKPVDGGPRSDESPTADAAGSQERPPTLQNPLGLNEPPTLAPPPDSVISEETKIVKKAGEPTELSKSITTAPADGRVVEKEVQVGFFEGIKLKLSGWFAALGGTSAMRQYQEDIASFGVPLTIVKYAVFAVIAAFLLWFLYHAIQHIWGYISKRWLTTSLVAANSTPTNTVIVASADKLDELEKLGWTVVRRT